MFLIFIGIFLLINAPALGQQLSYWWQSDIGAAKPVTPTGPAGFAVRPPTVSPPSTSPAPTNPVASTRPAAANYPADLPNNRLYIPRTKTLAPVIWDVSSGGGDVNSELLKALESGVVRYPQTALPNQIGNVFLTGHSSNYWWEKGRYKTVFALLNRLVSGDLIYLKYQDQLYIYKVSGQKVVKPTETSVLDPTTKPILSLMTCTPTGTALLRRIVTADLISPKEGLSVQPTRPETGSLQAVR